MDGNGTITVVNMTTQERRTYVGCSVLDAVIAAFAQERGDYNTWEYARKYGQTVETGTCHFFCGDWAVRR